LGYNKYNHQSLVIKDIQMIYNFHDLYWITCRDHDSLYGIPSELATTWKKVSHVRNVPNNFELVIKQQYYVIYREFSSIRSWSLVRFLSTSMQDILHEKSMLQSTDENVCLMAWKITIMNDKCNGKIKNNFTNITQSFINISPLLSYLYHKWGQVSLYL